MKSLDITENKYILCENSHIEDPIDAMIKKVKKAPQHHESHLLWSS